MKIRNGPRVVRLTAALALLAGSASALATFRSVEESGRDGSTIAAMQGALMGAPTAEPRIERGSLRRGDTTLNSGEYYDTYEVRARQGQHIRVRLASDDFDPYLIVKDPNGEQTENDDAAGDSHSSLVELEAPKDGRYQIMVTSYEANERGDYTLTIEVGDEGDEPSAPARSNRTNRPPRANDTPVPNRDAGGSVIDENGTLRRGDEALRTGEFMDRYEFEGREGQHVVVHLESEDFDPYLILKDPNDEQQENDDLGDSRTESQIDYVLTTSGTHVVMVTSYEAGETGDYHLTVTLEGEGERPAPARDPEPRPRPQPNPRPANPDHRQAVPVDGEERIQTQEGTLEEGDATLSSGEWADRYTIQAEAGQHVVVRLNSTDFDTYLIVQPPEGEAINNDDFNGSTTTSFVEATATTTGEWRVQVTSYEPGETGDYELTTSVSNSDSFYEPSEATPINASGGEESGSLEDDDLRRFTGEFADVYTFEGQPGRFYTVEVTTHDRSLDPYLLLNRASGANLVNDDFGGSTQRSRLQFLVTQPGPVDLIVSSFKEGMTGDYDISVSSESSPPEYHHEPSVVPGRVFGVFAGITDYSGRDMGELAYCARDAQRAYDAAVESLGMDPDDGVLLKDDDATVANFESAIRRLGDQLDYDDKLIVFYSGHGGQVERTTFQPADPDMLDEILVFADTDLSDDSLDETLRSVERGTVLLVLDSCNSGGFAKDVISRPGRMGVFASAEDCLSIVAPEREAGGYLADFFIECIGSGRDEADTNSDGHMTVIEMCQFIADRYRTEVTSDSKPPVTPRQYERTISPTEYRGYQQLLIDRGSIGPHEVLFGW